MTDHETDPVVQRAVDELRRLPPVDQTAVRRIAAAAAAARLAPADDSVLDASRPRVRWWVTIGLTAAAAIAGFITHDLLPSRESAPAAIVQAPAPTMSPAPLRSVTSSAGDATLVPQQFVLENTAARRVSVVGDFNNWNPSATPMSRSTDSGLWSAIVPMVPGRHVYGFMVNDSIFTLDPRNPVVRDRDFGTDVSVKVVGRP